MAARTYEYSGAGTSTSAGSGAAVPSPEYQPRVLGWLKEAAQEGEHFLKKQYGYDKIDSTMRMIMGEDLSAPRPEGLSNVTDNEFGLIALQLAAAMTDVKPFWEYRTSNQKYEHQCDILNKLAMHWFLSRQIDQRLLDAAKYSLAGGTGYLHTIYDPTIGDFDSQVIDPRDVLPVRPNGSQSLQQAFAVIIRQEKTVNELRMRWPQKNIRATRDGSVASAEEQGQATRILSQLNKSVFTRYREFLTKAVASFAGGTIPVTDQFTCYVHDNSRNMTSDDILMGPWSQGPEPRRLTNWAYRVKPGDRLYPRLRVIVATPTEVLYDGPSNYWHGQIPIGKLTLDSWPFPNAFLGKSPLWDLQQQQKSLDDSERMIADHCNKFTDPDLVVDQSTGLSQASIDRINSRRAGGKFKRRPGPGKGFEWQYPPPLPPEILTRPSTIIDRMNTLAGTRDLSSLSNLGQIPSSSTIEMMMQAGTGPVRARSRALEAFMREYAMQMAFNFIQYRTVAERLQIVGPDGLVIEDFDYEPGNLIPAHLGSDFDSKGDLKLEAKDHIRPREDRARELMGYFTYNVVPGTLLKAAKVTDQMMYMQLFRMGILDPWTLMEKLEVPNVGEAPGRTVTERLAAAAQMGLTGQVSAAGRKSSGQEPPQMKSSGAISESG